VQFVGDPGPLAGQCQLAAALVRAGVGQGDRGVVGEDAQQVLVVLGEAAEPFGQLPAPLVGQEECPEDLVAVQYGHPGAGSQGCRAMSRTPVTGTG
jgi:hypothetical protein